MQSFFHAVFNDTRVQIALLLLILDFVLGIGAALYDTKQGFRFTFVADTLRTDVLGKMVPFFVLYAGYLYAAHADIVIPGLDLEVLMNAAWVVVLAAFAASILNSLKDFGFTLPDVVAGDDPVTPTPLPPNTPE